MCLKIKRHAHALNKNVPRLCLFCTDSFFLITQIFFFFFFFLFVPQALKSVVLYVVLSPYDNEQSDLVHRISADKKLEEIPKYKYVRD